MEGLVVSLILLIAMNRLLQEFQKGSGMPEWVTIVFYKWGGALAGSILAAWFRKSTRWLFQVVAGAYIGRAAGPWLLDYLGWPHADDYTLFAGSIMGVTGYSILEGVLSIDFKALAKWYADRKTGAVNDPPASN
jgi:hypothetical protein